MRSTFRKGEAEAEPVRVVEGLHRVERAVAEEGAVGLLRRHQAEPVLRVAVVAAAQPRLEQAMLDERIQAQRAAQCLSCHRLAPRA